MILRGLDDALMMSEGGPKKNNTIKKMRNAAALFWVAVIVVTAILLLPDNWMFWALILVVAAIRIIVLLAPRTRYKCSNCGATFQWRGRRVTLMPTPADLNAANEGPKCPKCGSRTVQKERARV